MYVVKNLGKNQIAYRVLDGEARNVANVVDHSWLCQSGDARKKAALEQLLEAVLQVRRQ